MKDIEIALAERHINHAVKGAIHDCINAHGPITKPFICSVQKRILRNIRSTVISQLVNHYRKEAIENPNTSFDSLITDRRVKELEEIVKSKDAGIKHWKNKYEELISKKENMNVEAS